MVGRGVSSHLEQRSCPSMYFRAPHDLHEPPAVQANTDCFNILNPKIHFIKGTGLEGAGKLSPFNQFSLKWFGGCACTLSWSATQGWMDACGNEGCSGGSGHNVTSSRDSCVSGLVHLATALSCSTRLRSAQHCSWFSQPHLLQAADKRFWGMM